MDKVWVIEAPDEILRDRKTKPRQAEVSSPDEKDPAKAYSWSVLLWGGGQFYNDQGAKGLYFFLLMLTFHSGILFTVLSWQNIARFLPEHGMSLSVFLLAALVLLLCALTFWRLCCSNAYHGAAKSRKKCFPGTRSRVFPFICSILLPGWGQFLNGQPLKGGIFAGFSVVSYFSIFVIPIVLLTWKDLEPSLARFLVESIFTIAVLFLPLIPIVWILSSYDALKVSLEEWKKKPLWERIKLSKNLHRDSVWGRRTCRRIKRTFALALFLMFLLVVFYSYSPRRFYSGELASARSWLQTKGMTLLPNLLGGLPHGPSLLATERHHQQRSM